MGRYTVQALDRGLALLSRLAESGGGRTLSQLAGASGLPESTVFRLLSTLEERRLVRHERGAYRLAIGCAELGAAYFNGLDALSEARPVMQRLGREVGENVHLGALDGADIVYLEKVSSGGMLGQNFARPGLRVPAHASGIGKALLAARPRGELSRLWPDGELPAITPRTITKLTGLADELDSIRARGYSIDAEELIQGVRSVAAVVHGADGDLMGLSIGGPAQRFAEDRIVYELWPALARAVAELSELLGGNPVVPPNSTQNGYMG